MLRLNNLRGAKGATRKKKRLGRGPGSGTGDTSTKGHKGQWARKSGGPALGYEGGQTPLYRRVPKRGFTNIFRKKYIVVNVGDLERFNVPEEISLEVLKKARVVKGKEVLLKVLGDGEIRKKITVKAHKFTKTAAEKIKKAGGLAKVVTNGNQ